MLLSPCQRFVRRLKIPPAKRSVANSAPRFSPGRCRPDQNAEKICFSCSFAAETFVIARKYSLVFGRRFHRFYELNSPKLRILSPNLRNSFAIPAKCCRLFLRPSSSAGGWGLVASSRACALPGFYARTRGSWLPTPRSRHRASRRSPARGRAGATSVGRGSSAGPDRFVSSRSRSAASPSSTAPCS